MAPATVAAILKSMTNEDSTANARSRRPTSADVAKEAGVSRATVSYVLNGVDQSISEETSDAVLRAARRLGYRPNLAARSLAGQRSNIVMLILRERPLSEFAFSLVRQLSTELANYGVALTVHIHEAQSTGIDVALDLKVRAVVLPAPISAREEADLTRTGVRVHHLDEYLRRLAYAAGQVQVEHLAAMGHSRIALVPPANVDGGVISPRRNGVTEAGRRLGLPPVTEYSLEQLDQVMKDGTVDVTAVCAYNDDVAFAVLAAAARAGVAVPLQLAVIGVDAIALGAVGQPPLTSVSLNVQAVAKALASQIAEAEDPGSLPIPSMNVIARDSA